MQLINALCTVSALLPFAIAKPTPHAHQHHDTDYADLDRRQVTVTPGSTPRCSQRGAHIVATSGHGAPNVGGYGLLSSLVMSIKAAVPYSNNISTAFDKDNPSPPVATMDGVSNLTAHIKWYTAGCPNTPIILLGYSEGAIVTGNTLCGRSVPSSPMNPGIDPAYAKYIAATILYGDETRSPGFPYNYGTCTTGQGVIPRQQSSTCGVYAENLRSWCDMNDPQCCVTQSPNSNQSVHYVYPSEYDGDATQFAVQGFLAWKKARRNGTPWPTASAYTPTVSASPSATGPASSVTASGTSVTSATSATTTATTSGTSAISTTSAPSSATSTTTTPTSSSVPANVRIAAAPAPLGGQTVEGASPTNSAFQAWIAQTKSKVEAWLNGNGFRL